MLLAAVMMVGSVSMWGQTSVQNFGTGTGTHTSTTGSTSFIPAPTPSGTTYARSGTATVCPIVLATGPNLLGTTGSYVRGVAGATTYTKICPNLGYTSSTEFYTSFTVMLGDASGGNTAILGSWGFYQGSGTSFSDNNNFTGSQVFTGLQFNFGTGGTIGVKYRNGSSWSSSDIATFASSTVYTIEIIGNNKSSGDITYTYDGISQTVGPQKIDLFINKVRIGNDLNAGQLTAGSLINSIMFIGTGSTGNTANIFIDDVVVYNTVPATIGTSSCSTAPELGDIVDDATTLGSVTLMAEINDEGDCPVTEYGFAYNTTGNPDIETDTKIVCDDLDVGIFTTDIDLTGLDCGETYYFRAYAVNGAGTSYNNSDFTVNAPACPPVCNIVAPVASAAEDITMASFTAKWTGDAENYSLVVYTKEDVPTEEILAKWTFPNGDGASVSRIAEQASDNNAGLTISSNAAGGTYSTPQGYNGSTGTYALSIANWVGGNGNMYWLISGINTVDFSDLTISSAQFSSATGPRDFKLQYQIGAGTWTDIPNGSIDCSSTSNTNWSGVITDLPLPSECENREDISIRWIMDSNFNVGGTAVSNTAGASRIDNIYIKGMIDVETKTPVSGYPKIVAGTSDAVSGLAENTEYYYVVKAYGKDACASELSEESNEIKAKTLSVTGIETPQIAGIYVAGNTVFVNARAGETIEIYNILGKQLVSLSAQAGENGITLPSGVLFVRVAGQTAKVIVK